MKREEIQRLIRIAEEQMSHAYAPYSHFQVGAALLTAGGKVYAGCNIENAAFSPGTCAERTALYKAVSEGAQSFSAIAVVGRHEGMQALTEAFTTPCGVCRQALTEFCAPDMPVFLADAGGNVGEFTLKELLPYSFGPKDLDEEH